MPNRRRGWMVLSSPFPALAVIGVLAVGGGDVFAGLASQGLASQGLASQGLASQGLASQGLASQGLASQGLASQGLASQGLASQGLASQGLASQGLASQGLASQGLASQGLASQGLASQGLASQGVSLFGSDIPASELKGAAIARIIMGGTVSTDESRPYTQLTGLPTMSTGTGNYISVGGQSAVGHYASARMLDANNAPLPDSADLDLYIAGEMRDPIPNLFHNPAEQDNEDQLYVVYALNKFSGQWASLCPYDGRTRAATAMAIAEDPSRPTEFVFACTATGVMAKCARNWGYRPWDSTTTWQWDAQMDNGTATAGDWVQGTVPLRPYYEACKVAARAAYCQDDKSFTKNGTMVDLFDTSQIIWPNAVENPFSAAVPGSRWMMAQEFFVSTQPRDPLTSSALRSAMQRTRYRELSPEGQCAEFPFVDRLEHDHIEDGRWLTKLETTDIHVFSPTSCTHDEFHTGAALPWDCTPCTTAVCREMPGCCGADVDASLSSYGADVWSSTCTAKAASLAACKDSAGAPLPGLVWPKDVPPSKETAAGKYLLGAGGAVLRVDGTGAGATVSGWACDPEWSGGATRVRIYAGYVREDERSHFITEVRADRSLALSLASEVSAACDGPNRGYAWHGFSASLAGWTSAMGANLFVYAVDEATSDGPAAPPTLLRNGIVHVPTCEHPESVVGAALPASCSACAAQVCAADQACCADEWDGECVARAAACAGETRSAPASASSFTEVATGWIEAPFSGTYTFASAGQPSRLWIDGQKVLDWGPWPREAGEIVLGSNQGQIVLTGGTRYHIRWDRLQGAPSAETTGLTWHVPGAPDFSAIPRYALYAVAPGGGQGLSALYLSYATPGLGGLVDTAVQVDATVDINNDVVPPGTPVQALPAGFDTSYAARWSGEIVPPISGDYVFHVVGGGVPQLTLDGEDLPFVVPPASPALGLACAHPLCDVGEQLDPSCDPCVAAICERDPYCCDGGYHSYYSTEPTWDAKCIAEVKAYCPSAAANGCTGPLPKATPRDIPTVTRRLVAGVHYSFELYYDNVRYAGVLDSRGRDKTVKLLWETAGLPKQVVPQYALYPGSPTVRYAGSGLNVTLFPTANGGAAPDLTAAVATGLTPDLSGQRAVGQLGTPLVDVLTDGADPITATVPPPLVVQPRYGETVFGANNNINNPTNYNNVAVKGVGGVPGNVVEIRLQTGPNFGNPFFLTGVQLANLTTTVASDGTFAATVPVPGVSGRPWQLRLRQRKPLSSSVSTDVVWPFTVARVTTASGEIEIVSPRDPTHSPDPTANTFQVYGHGAAAPAGATAPQPVTVRELAGSSAQILGQSVSASADGTITGSITLSSAGTGATADPIAGWHKLVFSQTLSGGSLVESAPVFVSVGLKPPIVDYPRSGAQLGCSDTWVRRSSTGGSDDSPSIRIEGRLPYSASEFGFPQVYEETGQGTLRAVPVPACTVVGVPGDFQLCVGDLLVDPTPGPDGMYGFSSVIIPGPGKHVLRVFQAPPPPAGLTAAQLDAYFRPYAAVAAVNPVVINETPPRFEVPGGAGPLDAMNNFLGLDAIEGDSDDVGIAVYCNGPVRSPLCAQPYADLNLYVNGHRYTARANQLGAWDLGGIRFNDGWNTVSVTQVADSAGGAWSESCPSNPIQLANGVVRGVVQVPADISVPATSPAGAVVSYPPVSASVTVPPNGPLPMPVICDHPSGSTFPAGTTLVICTATLTNPVGALAFGTFRVTVTGALPVIQTPDQVVAEATDPQGAAVAFTVTATDGMGGEIPVECAPPSGSRFNLGVSTNVVCHAGSAGHIAQATFPVLVVDTTPPTLTVPGDITVEAGPDGTAIVTYDATATDLGVGTIVPGCFPASGSTFVVGTTSVSCSAADEAGYTAQAGFTVTVLPPPNTPPVVTVPANMTVEASGASGATVSFSASASDAQDGPNRPVTCTPASGTRFALGTTTVTCSATDSGGMGGSASFTVTVSDGNGPTWSNVPTQIIAYATSTAGAKVSYTRPTATDAVDGPIATVTCTPASGAQFKVNKTPVTCTAADSRGNATSVTFTVWVQYQAPSDGTFFLIPLRADGLSLFRIGRPVPARFKLTGASQSINNLVATFQATKISNAITGTTEVTSDETVDDTDFVFKYRPLLNFYVYRWRTRDQTEGTYRLTATLGDGVVHQINVSLKR